MIYSAATTTVILFAYANFRVKLQSKKPRFVYQEPHLFVTNEESFPETRIGQGAKGRGEERRSRGGRREEEIRVERSACRMPREERRREGRKRGELPSVSSYAFPGKALGDL